MKFKKIIILAMMTGTSLSSFLYAQEQLPKDKPGTAVFVMSSQNTDHIMVTSDLIKEEKNHLQIDMKIPVMDNFKNKRFQKKLNKQIKKHQLCLKSTIEKDAIRNYQYTTKKGYPLIPYELMTNYNVKSNNEVFSLEITVYDYRGGAHGMTTKTYYNVDPKKSCLLSLQDITCKEEKLDIEKLNAEVKRQIEERTKQGEIFFDHELGFNGIKENQGFYITAQGEVVLVFGLYEIAPYASGIIEFQIPKEILSYCH